jgi:hypothetical protein
MTTTQTPAKIIETHMRSIKRMCKGSRYSTTSGALHVKVYRGGGVAEIRFSPKHRCVWVRRWATPDTLCTTPEIALTFALADADQAEQAFEIAARS